MGQQTIERLQIKTPEQRFLSVLENDFHKPPRVAQVSLEEAQACLLGTAQHVRPGQMRVILARRDAGHGCGLTETPMTEVSWTVDAGLEDREVVQRDRGLDCFCSRGAPSTRLGCGRGHGHQVFTRIRETGFCGKNPVSAERSPKQ